jgi:hypothetical protein
MLSVMALMASWLKAVVNDAASSAVMGGPIKTESGFRRVAH